MLVINLCSNYLKYSAIKTIKKLNFHLIIPSYSTDDFFVLADVFKSELKKNPSFALSKDPLRNKNRVALYFTKGMKTKDRFDIYERYF